jgi:hypothetical protein
MIARIAYNTIIACCNEAIGNQDDVAEHKTITYQQLAKIIDHSLLRPEMTEKEVIDHTMDKL